MTKVLTLVGDLEFDGHSVGHALAAAVNLPDVTGVVVDVACLWFLDSTGIAELVLVYREVVRRNQSFALVGARRRVQRVLELAGLWRLLTEGTVSADGRRA